MRRSRRKRLASLAPGDIPLLIRRGYNHEIYAYDLKLPQ
jgi:hypothetical protein